MQFPELKEGGTNSEVRLSFVSRTSLLGARSRVETKSRRVRGVFGTHRGRATCAVRSEDSTHPTAVRSANEFDIDRVRDDLRVVGAFQQQGHGVATALAEVDRPVVDVHPDELVGLTAV